MNSASEDLLLRVRRSEADILEQATEGWKADHDLAMLAGKLEDHIVLVRPFPERMREVCDHSWKLIQEGRLTDYRAWGEEILKLYDSYIKLLVGMQTSLQRIQDNGYEVQGAEDVARIHEALQRDQDELVDRWPWFDNESAAEGRAAFRRGELVDLDVAFAEAVGVSLEMWRQRVETRRQSLQD